MTSTRDARVVGARRLRRPSDRRATGLFLVEGPRVVMEALAAHLETGDVVQEMFATEDVLARHPALAERASVAGVPVHRAHERVVAVLSDTVTPQGVVAVARSHRPALTDVVAPGARLVAVLVGAADPGNVGTVIRVADAAGADAVVLVGDGVDPYNGKCVRASAGGLFHLPVVTSNAHDTAAAARAAGLAIVAATAEAEAAVDSPDVAELLAGPTAWFFGNEAHGLPEALRGETDVAVRVPIHGRAESLNLATAAAVCLYTSARMQRLR